MLEDYIPAGVRQKIASSRLWPGVLSAARTLREHFRLSGLPFFREYTDHTFQHSIDVFKSACDMMTEDALDIVSADDLCVLLVSCLVHDSGLHITEDVFLKLTDSSNSKVTFPDFDQKAWPELWADFLTEAQRFNDKKLISLFGDQEPVREPSRSAIDLSQRDKLLIGEFLRKHHPRFGHEFIVGAIPDARNDNFEFRELDSRAKDIVGLVARSHGLDLRFAFDYIEKHYDLRDYNRIHIVYLMVLIRIADFLQIQSARAPVLFGKLHSIKSPFSLGEWKLHQSIENITTSAMDPEAVSVLANPRSVHDYLRFEGWMRGFQSEIDQSWAVLGEVYGRFTREALNKLQLNVRRIRSNIEDKVALQKQSGFVPEPIRFSVSEPELLRLLMEPLYGENPTYGLRELTQNAADSIVELEHALRSSKSSIPDRANLTNDIQVEIVGEPDWTFTIMDRGSGMTLDTITNYFLKAGASFRNSELWKQDFTDSEGKSHIARTGRFGVGALSAYLIGEKVHIFTRHYTDKSGFGFDFACSIDDEQIEIVQKRGPIGTTIKVHSSERKIVALQRYLAERRWKPFFYISTKPTIGFNLSGQFPPPPPLSDWEESANKRREEMLAKPATWTKAECSKYEYVAWDRTSRARFPRRNTDDLSGFLYSNGILIGDLKEPDHELVLNDDYSLLSVSPPPTISIIDHNAYLPVDLARKSLSRPDSELSEAIKRSIYRQLITEIVTADFNSASELIEWWKTCDLPIQEGGWIPFLFNKVGFCLLDRALMNSVGVNRLIVQKLEDEDRIEQRLADSFCERSTCIALQNRNYDSTGKTALLSSVQGGSYRSNLPTWERRAHDPYFSDQFFVFEKQALDDVLTLANAPNYLREMKERGFRFKANKTEYIIISRFSNIKGVVVEELANFVKRNPTSESRTRREPMILWEHYSSDYDKETLVSKLWESCFEEILVPYNHDMRIKSLRKGLPTPSNT